MRFLAILKFMLAKAKRWLFALPLWRRMIITSIASILGGASVIGFFNKYALYTHAIRNNFRVPVEGVEYIDLAVAIMSLSLLSFSLLGTAIIFNTLKGLLYIAKKIIRNFRVPKNKKKVQISIPYLIFSRKGKKISLFSKFIKIQAGLPYLLIILIMTVYAVILNIAFSNTESYISPDTLSNFLNVGIALLATISILSALISNLISKKVKTETLTLVSILIGIVTITSLIFTQPVYNAFLSRIQYGGEIMVDVEYKINDNNFSSEKGKLLMRTNRSIVLKTKDNDVAEIPMTGVTKILFLD